MKWTTWISGIIGTALAIWLYYNFVSWLSILNCALPPIGIIVILDYFFNHKKFGSDFNEYTINWFNIAGIIVALPVQTCCSGALPPLMLWWLLLHSSLSAKCLAKINNNCKEG